MRGKNPLDLEEKRSLGLAFKCVGPAQSVLLRDTRDAEWLAGEPGQEHVMFRYPRGGDRHDVAGNVVIAEVRDTCAGRGRPTPK